MPARWAREHPGSERVFTTRTMPFQRCDVPQQDNHCDCGLFVLAHIEFFIYGGLAMEQLRGQPLAINFSQVGELAGWCSLRGYCWCCLAAVQRPSA